MDVRIELCTSAKVYKKDNTRRVILFSVLIALYAIVIPYCYFTAGEPRKAAMIHAQKLADEKWALESSSLDLNSTVVETNEFIEVIPDSAESTADTNEEDEAVVNFGESGSKSSGIGSWFGPTKEQIRAKKEFEKWQREFKEKSGESATLPPEYLPSAWACLALFATLTAHALFHLLCHWIVAFKAMALFQPAKKVEEGCFILITPPPNRGHGAMVEVKKSATAGTLQVDFQRQKYIYTPASKLGDNAKLYPNGVLTLTAYPVNLPLSQYASAAGLRTDSEVERTLEVFGKNHLAVAIPSFLELLQLQLLSPLAIFQVFCALLWLLDEYWSYTVFTLVSVVVYEATTVFQRTRTQQMLGGMSPKPTPIFVYRCSRWVMTTTKDLLPGDVISLAYKKRAMNKGPAAPAPAAPASTPTAAPTPTAPGTVPGTPVAAAAAATASPAKMVTTFDEIVPCDCLLLRGSAVVNEASLTGESVPQMKEAIVFDSTSSTTNNEEKLDMSGANRVNTLFSGSSLVTVDVRNVSTRNKTESTTDLMAVAASTHETSSAFAHIPPPPDGGALAYVLRTGFGSSQGNLLQMIEFSQQTVTGDSRETGMALLMLFVFALMASGYVLKEGLRKKEKTTHEILLKCVIIITSVVPRQFPMQMAMAVNMALMSLSKAGIFCTEPYRVPLAGKVSHCLFDKTGTLTTDQLVPVGIINHSSSATAAGGGDESDDSNLPALSPVGAANAETAMILAACHSLVVVDDGSAAASGDDAAAAASNPAVAPFDPKNPVFVPPTANLVGDPIEVAAIKGIDWSWDAPTSTATPDGAVKRQTIALAISRRNLAQLNSLPAEAPRPPNYLKNKEILEAEIKSLESKLVAARQKASTALYNSIQVIQRHHFSSALQRMSVVCRCNHQHTGTGMESKSSSSSDHWYCLVKGSPEALKQLIVPSAVPSWYTACYESMARKGLRVLALAYKRVYAADSPADKSRQWVEKDLYFGGFIAFECKIRADSGVVVKSLIKADHKVAMLTGDALLTSLHVAKQVGICDTAKDCLTLHKPKTEGGSAYWVRRTEASGVETEIPFDAATIPKIGKEFNLLTIEETFLTVAELTGGKSSGLWKHAGFIKVFARMSPQGKASIIQSIQDSDKDHHVFMCGDGGNDVGALKQADIGLALLAGHANANTSEDILPPAVTNTDTALTTNTGLPQDPNMSPEDYLNLHDKKLKARADVVNKLRAEHMKEFQARYTKEQQALLQEQIRQKTEAGEYMAMFTLMKDQAARIKQAMADENARFMAMHGQVWDPKKDGDGLTQKTGVEKMMESLDTGDAGGLQMIRPGDASVAAPFTSRIPSVRAVIDLIRQGRCTLLSALMQQQIMMLESIIAAYTLSALSLHNARSSERQMMASSWLIMTAAVSFSYASPLDHMHPLRPLRSLFHPAMIISTLGQAAIHIACMTLAVQWATDAMGPEKLKEVTEFFRKAKLKEIDAAAGCAEEDFMCQFQAYWAAPFMPNLLNSVVFLVETSQMISVFFANYKGRPWMKGMMENHPLFLSVFACVGGVIVAAWEMVPQLNEMIQLAPFPDDWFRYKVVLLVVATIAGTFLWDRLCTLIFAPAVFRASMEEASKLGFKDFKPILMTLMKVAGVILVLGSGNLLLMGGAFFMYRSYSQKAAQAEQAALLK